MAMIWNPTGESVPLDENGQPDYRAQQQQAQPDYDLDAFYQRMFGRAPDANERQTDMANIQKYGAAGFEQDAQKRLGNGAQQQAAPQYATPTQQWNAQPAMQPQSDALFKLLMERAQQPTAVNRNDPSIRAQVDPVVAQQERASRNYIDDIAEKSGPLANIQGERRLAAERGGQAAGALEAEVIGREQDARRQEIMQSLGLGAQFLTAEQQLALQRELGYLQDASRTADRDLQRQGLGQANDQFLRELALREFDLGNTWDYRWGMGV